MIKYAYLKREEVTISIEQIDAVASEHYARAKFDTRHGQPVIAVEFEFDDDTLLLHAIAQMGFFQIAMKPFKRHAHNLPVPRKAES